MSMRVLILSCNTGEGHNSCARAIKEVFDTHGEECDIKDALEFISPKVSSFLSRGHVFVYRYIPWLFRLGYRFTEEHTSVFREGSYIYNFFARGADDLHRFILQGRYDAVICTHPFASLMLTETLNRYQSWISFLFVATDYTCSPGVKDSRLDYYFIPSEKLSDEFECPNIPRHKIIASGIPVRQMFYKHSKSSYTLPGGRKNIIMMCGSMGCGPIKKLTNILTQHQSDFDLTVICGTNKRLRNRLICKYGDRINLHICGYVKNMSAMLDTADIYLTKPGGISVTEAAIKSTPMVLIDSVAGCEEHNGRYFTLLGGAAMSSDAKELAHICKSLLASESRLAQMRTALSGQTKHNAAEQIYSVMKTAKLRHDNMKCRT